MSSSVLFIAVFLASAVEAVEALTIVLASGTTRGWKSTFQGAAAALATLSVLVIAFGPALVHYVPIKTLRIVVGGLLLIYGLQWLRKAILRQAGFKAKHDEDRIYKEKVEELSKVPKAVGYDSIAFTVSFKGVFLEGLEVVIIVLTLGTSAHQIGLAAMSALAAVLVVSGIGALVSKQLSKVPENTMKMGVGLMLISFGTFWSGEGLGVKWPGSDLSIIWLILLYGVASGLIITYSSYLRNSMIRAKGSKA